MSSTYEISDKAAEVDAEKLASKTDSSSPATNAAFNDEGQEYANEEGERPEPEPLTSTNPEQPLEYTAFSKNEVRFIVFMCSWAGFFSPVSANIYFPALETLAQFLHVSDSLINLTITSYMIFQGLAPTIIGSLSDSNGRRPAYMICFTIYIGANIGLALQSNYAALLVLRMVQSAGSSGTVALASAVVADVSTSSQRGMYMGLATAGALLGPSIGPIVGGLLCEFLGWRSVFWFLTIFAGCFLVPFILFYPETGRRVVGNGSIPPQGWNMSVMNYLKVRKQTREAGNDPTVLFAKRQMLARQRRFRFPNPFLVLRIVFELEVGLVLLFNALLFCAMYDVTSGIPSQYAEIYGFNDLQIGLSYIPLGVGASIAAIINGKLVDRNYRRLAKKHGMPLIRNRHQDLRNFPIEACRIQIVFPMLFLGSAALIAYGWVLDYETSLAGPLVLLFFLGYCLAGAFNVLSTLTVDLYPQAPATVTAANNLVRCLLGAGATALVLPMIHGMGRGWCYTFLGLALIGLSPILLAVIKWGPKWREEKRIKDEEKQAKRDARDEEAKRREVVENGSVEEKN
ncbi:MAG: hypothetical protein M1834_006061 [Cirrosporium novae-zelandiae]|nr:MAG: hypothetical protein M1834_006061 [Cirrosporium novae-zelandiae]